MGRSDSRAWRRLFQPCLSSHSRQDRLSSCRLNQLAHSRHRHFRVSRRRSRMGGHLASRANPPASGDPLARVSLYSLNRPALAGPRLDKRSHSSRRRRSGKLHHSSNSPSRRWLPHSPLNVSPRPLATQDRHRPTPPALPLSPSRRRRRARATRSHPHQARSSTLHPDSHRAHP